MRELEKRADTTRTECYVRAYGEDKDKESNTQGRGIRREGRGYK